MPPTCGHAFPHLCGALSAALVGGLLAQLADGVVGAFGGLATVGCRRAETTAAATAASRLGQHLARVFMDGFQICLLCFCFFVDSLDSQRSPGGKQGNARGGGTRAETRQAGTTTSLSVPFPTGTS